jgi:site-specific DNA-methyltransferase (cytosine-N4-specific)
MIAAYKTNYGTCFLGDATLLDKTALWSEIEGKVDLLFTSPPFALARQKEYGNLAGEDYVKWFSSLSDPFSRLLKPRGSIVIEMGNAWVKGKPVMATQPLRALIEFAHRSNLHLCQQFIWHNPARLPSPAQWVNVERIRVKDSFTHIWWMSKHLKPKADNRRVLKEYSQSMLDLLERGTYNAGSRPSEHQIGETSFLTDNNGAIPSNVFTISNTRSSSPYLTYCKQNNFKRHPARMPSEIVEFFVKFLTEANDLVLDPFSGSNTTGAVAESLGRSWISIEKEIEYILGSRGRFAQSTDLDALTGLE